MISGLGRHAIVALVVLTLASLLACTPATPPNVRLAALTPRAVDLDGIDFDVALAVTNPNSFDLTIVRYSYALSVMGLPLGTGQNEEAITFPANKQNTIHLPVRVTHRHLLSAITRLPDPDRVPYHLKAELTFATPFGEKMVPLDRHGHFPLPERYRPKAILKGILERIAP